MVIVRRSLLVYCAWYLIIQMNNKVYISIIICIY